NRCTTLFFQAEHGKRDWSVTGVQTCALPILYIANFYLDGNRNGIRLTEYPSGGFRCDFHPDKNLRCIFHPLSQQLRPHNSFHSRSEERRVGKELRAVGERDQ